MAEEPKGGPRSTEPAEAEAPESGVMGALPRSRPSIRSPRRDAAAARRAKTEPAAEPSAEQGAEQPGFEDLARAGASVAVGAAALGLRVAGRAASAVRGALERR